MYVRTHGRLGRLAALPATAHAQQTNCVRNPMGWNCNTTPNDGGAGDFAAGMQALGNAARARQTQKNAAIAFRAALEAGDCQRAMDLAIQYGNARDVKIVQQSCRQSPPPQ